MAICTKTTVSQLRSSFIRMDAEFFKPEHIDVSGKINSIPNIKYLGHISEKITQGANPKFSETGLACVNGKNVYFGTMTEGEPNYVSSAEFKRLATYVLRRGDLVITLKHATKIGRIWIVEDDHQRIFSRNIGMIRLRRDSPIKPSVLLLYLWSRYGQFLIDRCATGGTTGQITLPMSELRRVPVPPINEQDQSIIDEIFCRSRNAAKEATEAYHAAQQLLESELGLDKLSFQKSRGYTAKLSGSVADGRFDAEYFQPQFSTIQQLIKQYSNGFESLINCVTSLKPNIDPSNNPSQLYNYIELSNINASLGTVDGFETKFGQVLPSRARRLVQFGDVIASSVVGSIDKAAIVDYDQDGFIASTGFFHLRPKTISSEYLLMLIRSKCVQMQFHQQATGGILSAVPDSRLKHIIIPRLPESLRSEISVLVKRSHFAKRQSQELLEQAKARVEQLIEEAVQA